MSGKIIDGKKISADIREEVRQKVQKLQSDKGITPGLAFIIAGSDPASHLYVKSKKKACLEAGIYSITNELPAEASQEEIIRIIEKHNSDEKIHGILVQLPLPDHINEDAVIQSINYKKDVDGFHPVNVGRLNIGLRSFVPCTPLGIKELLIRSGIETKGKDAVVIGRSNIVGKPAAALLLHKDLNCTVTVCHSATKNIYSYTSKADIIIAAIGKSNFVTADIIKDGSVIIDVGINRVEDANEKKGYRITGDVDYADCYEKCSKITPVPGGVGPMTIAMLMKNTYDSASGAIY